MFDQFNPTILTLFASAFIVGILTTAVQRRLEVVMDGGFCATCSPRLELLTKQLSAFGAVCLFVLFASIALQAWFILSGAS